ncbi:type VI secretion system lipoprotein TssJ [Paraburkholderia sp. SOS3]|jgi:type VI secretion system protein VasD|uniref:type VI secretion system lipoprotein TssJ n=1 Tax=Paraburkholderia sp. SOS3 TaxID=1926494 RepID=UPI00094743B7|nr:type VI secretion system lipoprotein TssJ [Paraburkholderia sp. SOS3]APR38882.1 type VI secretion system-associated lipoprotein [Paraburkholderia sp. SOS3]
MRPLKPVIALVCALTLASCAGNGSEAAHEPVKLELSVKAASTVNPDDQKRAAPIVVRIYELKNADTFEEADFFSLQDKDKTVLTDDLVMRDQFQLRPGESKTIRRKAAEATTTLGVLAAYRDLPNSIWRATWTLPATPSAAWYRRTPKVQLTIDLDTSAIRITDARPQNK